ncbi:protein SRC2-like [Miscanthus floridulus]|uniref:protein SRC2-like n=1 Tax=Miscanthus floridulus TaxID=154761 RepID=UPI00345A2828
MNEIVYSIVVVYETHRGPAHLHKCVHTRSKAATTTTTSSCSTRARGAESRLSAVALACRTLVSARDLRSVNLVSKMEVYTVAYLADDPRSRQRVPTDRAGGRDPTWNQTVLITVPASGAGCGVVRVLLRTERALGGDRDVGEVFIRLPDVLAGAGDGPTEATVACFPVHRIGSRKPQGVLPRCLEGLGKDRTPAYLRGDGGVFSVRAFLREGLGSCWR